MGTNSAERLQRDDLVPEMARNAPSVGPNACAWSDLTFYRFTGPMAAQWDEVRSLSLCFVAQGRKRVAVTGGDVFYDPFHYVVLTRGQRFQAEILEGSARKPFLSFVLQIDPTTVRQVSAEMFTPATMVFGQPEPEEQTAAYASAVDLPLSGAILRFLRAISSGPQRRVLAPMYLQEIVYRVLRAEQCSRLLSAAVNEREPQPVSEVVRFITDHVSDPLSVSDLAAHVSMSPSALTRMFDEVTGMSPYQFVKRTRLDRARTLLVEDRIDATELPRAVGYRSRSHFVDEFKRHFGLTPRAYADQQRHNIALRVDRATSRAERS